MIHKIIVSNKVGSMILFPLILLVFQLPSYMQYGESLGSNISIFSGVMEGIAIKSVMILWLIKVVVILISSIILQRLVSKLELQRDRGHHALYWFAFLNSFFLSPEMDISIPVANLFLLLSLSRVFSIYRDSKVYSVAYDSGLYLGVAVLFNPFYILLLFFVWISLTTLKTLNYREVILVLSGLVTPVVIASFVIYFFDLNVPAYFSQISWSPRQMFTLIKNDVNEVNALGIFGNILTIMVLVYGVIKLIQIANNENTRRGKIFQLLFILTVFMAVIQLLSKLNGVNVPSVIILSVPLSAMMIHFFSGNRYKWVPLSLFYIWFVVVVINLLQTIL